jgi:hypothetical protein
MRQRLHEEGESHLERGFEFRYPVSTTKTWIRQLAWIFEEERKRLSQWIPDDAFGEPIKIELYRWNEFAEAYRSEVSVLGIFDKRIQLPLADLDNASPRLVQLVSHELAHAMIWRAAGNSVPRWYHEGLASRLEMGDVVNTIPDLIESRTVIALPMVEAVLEGFSEPQFVSLAYEEAQLAVRFLEEEYGVETVQEFLGAFGEGKDTEAAMAEILDLTPVEFDQSLRDWGQTATRFWPEEVRRYGNEAPMVFVEMAEKQAENRRIQPVLRSGKAFQAKSMETGPTPLQQWHPHLVGDSEVLSSRLRDIRALLRDGSLSALYEMGPICEELSVLLLSFQSSRAIRAPDPEIATRLRHSTSKLLYVASSCTRGELGKMDTLLSDYDSLNRQLSAELSKHGLTNPLEM